MSRVSELLHGGPVEQSEIDRVRDVVLFEGYDWEKRVVRFVCLLVLAASILRPMACCQTRWRQSSAP